MIVLEFQLIENADSKWQNEIGLWSDRLFVFVCFIPKSFLKKGAAFERRTFRGLAEVTPYEIGLSLVDIALQ